MMHLLLKDWKINHCSEAQEALQHIISTFGLSGGLLLESFFEGLYTDIVNIYVAALDRARNTTNENISERKEPQIWQEILSQTHRLSEHTWTPLKLSNLLLINKEIGNQALRTLIASAVQIFQRTLESFSFRAYKFKPLDVVPNVESFLKKIDKSEEATIRYIGGWVIFSLSIKHRKERTPKQLELFQRMTKEQVDKRTESGRRYREVVLTNDASTFVFGLEALLRAGYLTQVDPISIDPSMLEIIHKSLSKNTVLRSIWGAMVAAHQLDLSEEESVKSLQLYVQKYLRSRVKNFLKNADLLPGSSSALRARLKAKEKQAAKLNTTYLLTLSNQVLQETLGTTSATDLMDTYKKKELEKLLLKLGKEVPGNSRKTVLAKELEKICKHQPSPNAK